MVCGRGAQAGCNGVAPDGHLVGAACSSGKRQQPVAHSGSAGPAARRSYTGLHLGHRTYGVSPRRSATHVPLCGTATGAPPVPGPDPFRPSPSPERQLEWAACGGANCKPPESKGRSHPASGPLFSFGRVHQRRGPRRRWIRLGNKSVVEIAAKGRLVGSGCGWEVGTVPD
jgi:hypothetical protein